MTLTGDESLPEAHAAIDAVIHSRVAEWKLDQESREQRRQEKWIESATAVGLLIGFFILYVYAPRFSGISSTLCFRPIQAMQHRNLPLKILLHLHRKKAPCLQT